MSKKDYDDDDGRVIADMSGIDDRPVVSRWLGLPDARSKQGQTPRKAAGASEELDSEERRSFLFGAMKASLLLGMVYIVLFAVVIGILVLLW